MPKFHKSGVYFGRNYEICCKSHKKVGKNGGKKQTNKFWQIMCILRKIGTMMASLHDGHDGAKSDWDFDHPDDNDQNFEIQQ